jgi:hypothetical protein
MCYPVQVMLRGRGSCAISERPTTSPFVSPSLLSLLTPLFPLDASHSPVTPLFPLHTQKEGGPPCPETRRASSNMANRSISESSPARSSAALLFSAFPLRSSAHSAPLRYLFFFCHSALRGASSFFSGLSSPSCQISAKNAKSDNITLCLSIIVSNNVGAPTFFCGDRTTKNQQLMDRGKVFSSNGGLLFSPNPNHSRTSETFSRKSNHSRTYAKTRGWGCLPHDAFSPNSFVFSRRSNYMLNYMNNYIVGAPTFLSRTLTATRRSGPPQKAAPTKARKTSQPQLRATPFPSILDVPPYEAHLFGSQRDYRRRASGAGGDAALFLGRVWQRFVDPHVWAAGAGGSGNGA